MWPRTTCVAACKRRVTLESEFIGLLPRCPRCAKNGIHGLYAQQFHIATKEELDVDTLEDRLRAESIAAKGHFIPCFLLNAWARKPGFSGRGR